VNDILFSSWGGNIVDNRGKDPPDYQSIDNLTFPEQFKQGKAIKAMAGWNGLVIRTADVDILSLCRAYIEAVYEHAKTCDKCNYCKTGWKEQLEVFQDIQDGEATPEDLDFLQSTAEAIIDAGKCTIGKAGPSPLLHALKYFADDFLQAVSGEKKMTTDTYCSKLTAPCMDACPIQLEIPKYIEYIKDAKFEDSLAVIRERLPLPGVVGRVCFRPCEENCRRGNLDEPIAIKSLKRFVADRELSAEKEPQYQVLPTEKTGKVAVVGAGPAGITCAFHLLLKGHQVTIFENCGEPGGMSAVGIPDYRLPRQILRHEVNQIEKMGVSVNYNLTVGRDVTLSQLENEFDAVFIGIGAQLSTSMGIEGEDKGYRGFIQGLNYLREINAGRDPYPDGKRVVVIGGGNVAIDCVRSSFRLNREDVHLIYRRTRNEMPADRAEIHDAEEENVKFHFLTAPVRIVAKDDRVVGLECLRMKLDAPDDSGRPRPIPVEGSEFIFDCDTVIPAIGQSVDLSIFEGMPSIDSTGRQTVSVDAFTKQSSRSKIFAAGDCETGPDTLIGACNGGMKAAHGIDRFINKLPLEYDDNYYFDKFLKAVKVYDPEEEIRRVESLARQKLTMLNPETRKYSFEEVEQGFSDAEAVAEASRCLRCFNVVTVAM